MIDDFIISIKKTLAYFDIFDYPLTASELEHFLWDGPIGGARVDFQLDLDRAIMAGSVGRLNGFFFLPGREKIVETRLNNVLLVEHKTRIARRAIKMISRVPFVRAVFVCNTLAAGWPKKDSDIDLFIVAAHDKIWLVRMFVTLLMSITNLRRGRRKIADRVCLSFYVTENSLNLSGVSLDPPDVYLIYWLLMLLPVYGGAEYYRRVLAENSWTRDFVKNNRANYSLSSILEVKLNKLEFFSHSAVEKIFSGRTGEALNGFCKKIQLKKIAGNHDYRRRALGIGVVVNDEMLKFHENDRRAEYRERWREKITN